MKFKKIVGFGDSWIWGDELLDPALATHKEAHPILIENTKYRESHCFLGLLGKHYGVPVENFGIPGGSQQSTMWNYLWWLENEKLNTEDCLVLVGLTDAGRTSFYNTNHIQYRNDPDWNRYVHSSWIHSGSSQANDEWTKMVKQHTVLTDSSATRKYNYQQAVLFFEGQFALHKNVVQFCTLNPPMVYPAKNLIWPDRALTYLVNDSKYLAPKRHPNELGHAVIRDHLIPEIERVILA